MWFLSFYLQLKKTALEYPENEKIIFLDEPGGSLHQKAQEDVLKIFEDIKGKINIIYTTHSPYLLDLDNLHRILAVQRKEDNDDNFGTQVLGYHKLSRASRDTLSPLYTIMGMDLSYQNVIKKKRNVILEELSARYYLTAFWMLVEKEEEKPQFIPATGVTNIPLLLNLFIGWGLECIIVLDDDREGRNVYKTLKENVFLNEDDEAKQKIIKLTNGPCIEDLFSIEDFRKFIYNDLQKNIPSTISEFLSSEGLSKGVLATGFMVKVKNKEIKMSELTQKTQNNIKKIIEEISSILK